MIQHNKKNRILSLKSRQGLVLSTHNEIEEELHQHFEKILKEKNHENDVHIRKITNNIPTILSREHNQMLLKKIMMAEVEAVVQSMPNGKAPGPDGFIIEFYKF